MCFYDDDYDWVAEDERKTFGRGPAAKCHECRREITDGAWRCQVEQHQHEACQICEDDCSDDYLDGDRDFYDTDEEHAAALAELAAHAHDYGESFSCSICRECCLILEAIYDLERIEGCPEYARQPAYGALREELHEDRDGKYIQHAVELFPELATNELCTA